MSESPIYSRICACMDPVARPSVLLFGKDEAAEFAALCLKWNVDCKMTDPTGYNPDLKRATFRDVPIYVVDAKTHLQCL
jgi:hypothetical protein